jgi:pyruvate/2-oxoglutarate dehydrogenase complex dihydrolipoamide acyltransferase (E2) component
MLALRRTVTPVQIPKLGFSMTEGTIGEWLVADGDVVDLGQILYRLETDKVETDVEAPAGGVIRLIGEASETYPVGSLVAEITSESDA